MDMVVGRGTDSIVSRSELAVRAHAPSARFVGFAPLSLTDWPSEAIAPVARIVRFAPRGRFTTGVVGTLADCRSLRQAQGRLFAPLKMTVLPILRFAQDGSTVVQILRFVQDDWLGFRPMKLPRLRGEVFPSQPCLFAVELAESGEVLIVAGLEEAALEQEEGGDQIWAAADDAELAAELLPWVGHGAGTPLPPPVREAAVETVSNHEDMNCPEHQIRLSKGVIAKFVQRLELAVLMHAPDFGDK